MEEKYRKLLQATLEVEAFFEDFDDYFQVSDFDIWKEHDSNEPEHGSVTVFDFSNGDKAQITELNSSTELRHYFSQASPALSSSNSTTQPPKPTRRLFLLEGLDPRLVDVLGSQLGVPPMVFISQAASPGTIDLTDADGFLHDPSQYWNVQVQQLHKLSDGFYTHRGRFWNEHATPKRLAGTFVKRAYSWSFTQHLVSFWSTKHSNNSWDAVLLVDPAWHATVFESTDRETRKHLPADPAFAIHHDEKALPRAPSASMHALPLSADQWSHPPPQKPSLMSMRARLVDLYTRFPHGATADPASAAAFCKGFVFSLWEMTIRCLQWRYIALWDEEVFRSYHHHDVQWRRADFQKMADQQLVTRRVKRDFFDVCRKLGVVGDGGNGRGGGVGVAGVGGGGGRGCKERSWGWLLERITVLDEQIGDMIVVYGQRSSVEESLTANSQARSVGRLTALAAVLVPFSIAAGICSMSDEYAAGKSRFWVFWAIAVPLASLLLIWVFLVKRSPTQQFKSTLYAFRRWGSCVFIKANRLRSENREAMELPVWSDGEH
ncbi:Magnesium and cobalt transport protein [Lasiodiplodia theobromae]|uniref:Magnesium and cobalt transport protein n=1 Tax=Lasiodiplodia theobromae TaxID=45133 RepID=UPI0015C3F23F|nr:Magnesium and cobalt transport protein [Lasiodiplodia theobromae]KAF4546053.1 Magnesium and cobalt transport protein [Lasiodiplodia theobromae]